MTVGSFQLPGTGGGGHVGLRDHIEDLSGNSISADGTYVLSGLTVQTGKLATESYVDSAILSALGDVETILHYVNTGVSS